ncbi:MAG: L7Ae/L30e/S12e/Gadd45 family ribosomal protein [Acutalibacteraceae bacterium]
MNTPNKWQGLLGMAMRAGKLSIGFDATVGAVGAGKSKLVLLAADVSPKTAKECRFAADNRKAAVIALPIDKLQLSGTIGMAKPVGVVAVCDKGFANAIAAALQISAENGSQT